MIASLRSPDSDNLCALKAAPDQTGVQPIEGAARGMIHPARGWTESEAALLFEPAGRSGRGDASEECERGRMTASPLTGARAGGIKIWTGGAGIWAFARG